MSNPFAQQENNWEPTTKPQGSQQPQAGAEVRISDKERKLADTTLSNLTNAGYLTLEEYSDRVLQAMSACTRTELLELFADIPENELPAEFRSHPTSQVEVADAEAAPAPKLISDPWRLRLQQRWLAASIFAVLAFSALINGAISGFLLSALIGALVVFRPVQDEKLLLHNREVLAAQVELLRTEVELLEARRAKLQDPR